MLSIPRSQSFDIQMQRNARHPDPVRARMNNRHWLLAEVAAVVCVTAAPAASCTQSATDLDAISRWVRLHTTTQSLTVDFVELMESPVGRIDVWTLLERQTWSFRWPDAMHRVVLQTTVEPPLRMPFQAIPEWPTVEDSKATQLESVIEPDGKQVSRGPGGYTVVEGPSSLAEMSPDWFRVTPWLAARYIQAIDLKTVTFTRVDGALALSIAPEGLELVFESSDHGQLQLASVKEYDRAGTLTRIDTFSDYRPVPGLTFPVPFRRDSRMRALDGVAPNDPARPEWRRGSVRYGKVASVLELPSTLFSLSIPKSIAPSMLRVIPSRVASASSAANSTARLPAPATAPWWQKRSSVAVAVFTAVVLCGFMWYRRAR
ncbi:MAG: hypothetical protein JNM86_13160 [Phycisphaerae bacterium]|nr:hypothetical protein [Phycisphaerae bacterium]MBN8596457.1 hypothetical protein [Planctomycetota bacterium]